MAKPIFIVRLPSTFPYEGIERAKEAIRLNLGDEYKVLVLMDMKRKGEIKFECYNADHNEVEWNILEERVNAILKQNITP
jgi:hypothetical protein